jgi:ribosomal protein S18 acetylase RimI-like enzyme
MIKFNKAKKSHFKQIIELLASNISPYKPKKNFNIIWKNYIYQKNVYSITALYKKKIIGFSAIFFFFKIRGGIEGYINDVVVDKEYTRRKIGSKLVKKLIFLAKQKNCYKIVLQAKNSINFYKSLGFVKAGSTMRILIKKNVKIIRS